MTLVVGIVIGFFVGALTCVAGMAKDRKNIRKHREELVQEWDDFLKREGELKTKEEALARRGGSFEGRPS